MPLPARSPLARSDVETSSIRGMEMEVETEIGMVMGASCPPGDDVESESAGFVSYRSSSPSAVDP
jgi:hypothetical protein